MLNKQEDQTGKLGIKNDVINILPLQNPQQEPRPRRKLRPAQAETGENERWNAAKKHI